MQTFTNVYDRYGNRWQQEAPQGGSGLSVSFNQTKNQINSAGFSYNAAGDLTADGFHSYSYDAEGNLLQVDAGSTATYVYDALNHRVRTQDGSGTNEYLYDPSGKRISTWAAGNNYGNEGRIYWGNQQLGFRSSDGTTYFDHQDWTGTERARTNCFGTTSALYASFVYGDDSYAFDIQNANSGYNQDNAFYAGLDYDAGSGTDHAMFRQYTPLEGRWMSPDPYSGSYNTSNPQSFNRYSYVTNNPAALTDPTGLDGGLCSNPLLCVVATVGTIIDLEWLFSGPSFHGTLSPRPSTSNSNWDGNFGESLGIPTSIPQGNFGLGMALGLPSQGCEFGACGAGPSSLTPGQTASLAGPILIPASWLLSVVNLFQFPYADSSDPNHRLFGTHYCGPGGGGAPTSGLDQLCAAHDACYRANGVSAIDNLNPFTSGSAMGGCDRLLCTELGNYSPTSRQEAVGKGQIQQIFGCGYINK